VNVSEADPPVEALLSFALSYNSQCCGPGRTLLDEGKLRGAIGRPFQTWEGDLLIKGVARQGAALAHAMLQAHAFDDGNKRTAWQTLVFFLRGYRWMLDGISDQEGLTEFEFVIAHKVDVEGLSIWISDHLVEAYY
jgi:death-on-curing protein